MSPQSSTPRPLAAPSGDPAATGQPDAFPVAFDAGRYPPAYLRQGYLEAAVQKLVIGRLRQLGCRAFVVDSGAARLRGRAARAGVFLGGQATGMDRGIPDVHATGPSGRAVYVEVKAPAWLVISPKTGRFIQKRAAGTPSPQQVKFISDHRQAGALAGFAWGPQDVDRILEVDRG